MKTGCVADVDIYDWLAQQGVPSRLPGIWRNLPCHPGFFDLAGEPTARLSALQTAFAVDDLLRARVVQRDDAGNVTLSPPFAQETQWILALRQKSDAKPLDLLIDGQLLSRRYYSWGAVLADYRIPAMLENFGKQLLVTTSPADLAVAWSCGIPAIPPTWLHQIGGKPLSALCETLGIPRSNEFAPSRHPSGSKTESKPAEARSSWDSMSLVFADWSLATLDVAPVAEIASIVQHFCSLHQHLGLAVDDFAVWRPSPDDIAAFQFCAQYGDSTDIANIMTERLDDRCELIIAPGRTTRQKPSSVSEATSTLLSVLCDAPDEHWRQVAWKDAHELLETEIVAPLIRAGQSVQDPIRRNLIDTLANISRVLHPQALAIAAKFAVATRKHGLGSLPVVPHEELQQLLVLTDRIIALSQEIEPCLIKKPCKLSALRARKPRSTSGKSSASARR